jgi:hypothetical protein
VSRLNDRRSEVVDRERTLCKVLDAKYEDHIWSNREHGAMGRLPSDAEGDLAHLDGQFMAFRGERASLGSLCE